MGNLDSKKITTIGLTVACIIGIGFFVYMFPPPAQTTQKKTAEASLLKTYSNSAYGLEFKYPKKYFLETRTLGTDTRAHVVLVLTLDSKENKTIREGKAPDREIPSEMHIDIYQNTNDRLSVIDWLRRKPAESNFPAGGTYTETVIAGMPAFLYHWKTLREADSISFANSAWLYSVSVMYGNADDPIRTDFWEMIKTLSIKN